MNILAELEIRTHLKLDATETFIYVIQRRGVSAPGGSVGFARAKRGEQKEVIAGGGEGKTRETWKVPMQIEEG